MADCTATLNTKITPAEKEMFNRISSDLGLSPSVALRMFVREFNSCGGFPYAVRKTYPKGSFIKLNASKIHELPRAEDGTLILPSDWYDEEGDVYDELYGHLA